ncbi:mitogen-activated protein kinase kinase kinase 15-like isoform X2 [Dysidea avara]|uniref:mitogen-activated protein kinase kinase kinase 15-like isoform X2 n=1 Tax=Dysidea avara TaxID=196820 RepID=UPI00331F1237
MPVGKQSIIVAVYPDTMEGLKGLDALQSAAKELGMTCQRILFEKLDFGETSVLDQFYSADVAVADITEMSYQAVLSYHLGLRENFDMKQNMVTYIDQDTPKSGLGRRGSLLPTASTIPSLSGTSYTYIPYCVDEEGVARTADTSGLLPSNSQPDSPQCGVVLSKRFKKVLQDIQIDARKQYKEFFLKQLRKSREKLKGEELKLELKQLRGMIDEDPRLFTAEIILNLLLSYRDIQDYESMIELVDKLPNHEQMQKPPIQMWYAFALNRRNKPGDKDHGLSVMEEQLKHQENHVPDFLCLCGRIYKDKFVESDYTDNECRDKAIHWYREGFQVQPNEYAGINLATLLVISGKSFAASAELRHIGMTLNTLIGRKGDLESQQDYWIVATFFEISVLAENYTKTNQAALCMFKLKPPEWCCYWSQINNINYPTSVSIVLTTSLMLIYQKDTRSVFLYVLHHFAEDFQVFFSSTSQAQRFYDLVSTMMSEGGKAPIDSVTHQEDLQYEYEVDSNGDRVVLGKGSFGAVYSAIDLVTKRKMAIKEISDTGDFQSLEEEIRLHCHLQHKNIVSYYGTLAENGVFKIFMEQVPGGSLSDLLKHKWGPLLEDEGTIKFYTKQIIDGIKYLHEQKIVHRDIKGDNVLVNMYTGQLKISDFGTSKRLAGLQHQMASFKGTMQFMAPEVITAGQRGYGPPADIWSLGCTVVEMATGKPPFYDLGCPEAAIFMVGKYQTHPDIPESMSSEAQSFMLKCFEPDPSVRPAAVILRNHPFLVSRSSRRSFDRSQSTMPPSHIKPPTENSTQPNTVGMRPTIKESTDNVDAGAHNTDSVGSNKSDGGTPHHVAGRKSPVHFLLPISTPKTPGKGDFNQLMNYTQNQIVLNNVLSKEKFKIIDDLLNRLEEYGQFSHDRDILKDHLTTVTEAMITFVKKENIQEMVTDLNDINMACMEDKQLRRTIEEALFIFPGVVTEAHKRHQTPPHCIFAVDRLVHRAVSEVLSIVSPDTATDIGGQSTFTDLSGWDLVQDEQINDKGYHELKKQLKSAHDETLSLMTELLQVRQELNDRMRSDIHEQRIKLKSIKNTKPPPAVRFNLEDDEAQDDDEGGHLHNGVDDELLQWLRLCDAAQDSITHKLISEQVTLSDLLEHFTKDDLNGLGIKFGPRSRIWSAITKHRESTTK